MDIHFSNTYNTLTRTIKFNISVSNLTSSQNIHNCLLVYKKLQKKALMNGIIICAKDEVHSNRWIYYVNKNLFLLVWSDSNNNTLPTAAKAHNILWSKITPCEVPHVIATCLPYMHMKGNGAFLMVSARNSFWLKKLLSRDWTTGFWKYSEQRLYRDFFEILWGRDGSWLFNHYNINHKHPSDVMQQYSWK